MTSSMMNRYTGLRAGTLVLGLGLLFGGAGCGKSGVAAELAAFKDSGHAVSQFTETDAASLGAKKCQTGTIDKLAVLLCEYGSSEDAAHGHPAAEKWGGETGTVVVLHRASVLFAVADRNSSDPSGKSISALTKVFRHVKAR
jgi:hypothetical protein